jgi:DNA (cytosine-5)-methyltransferase 1
VLGADEVGAPHRRDRIYLLAHCNAPRTGIVDSITIRRPAPKLGNESEVVAHRECSRREKAGARAGLDAGRELEARGGTVADPSTGTVFQAQAGGTDGKSGAFVTSAGGELADPECACTARLGELSRGGDAESVEHRTCGAVLGDSNEQGPQGWSGPIGERPDELPAWPPGPAGDWPGIPAELWPATPQPAIRRVVDGLATRVDRLRACGNGVVPLAAAYAFRTLASRLNLEAP